MLRPASSSWETQGPVLANDRKRKKKRRSRKSACDAWERDRRPERERAPDAVWEGYLIDDITPLFPYFSPSCSPSFFLLTHARMSTHTHINTRAHCICPVTFLSLHDTPPTLLPAPSCPPWPPWGFVRPVAYVNPQKQTWLSRFHQSNTTMVWRCNIQDYN